MFAFAIWDRQKRELFVARDRLGKKPLFYYHDARHFVFGSEPKALLMHPGVQVEPDADAIDHFLTYGYVPAPLSAFRGIRKLPAGHYLVLRDGQIKIERYWQLRYSPKWPHSEAELAEEALAILQKAVQLRLISDVPLGALLSGGLDSSTVVALMRGVTSGRVRTFSIGFDERQYNELEYARQVSQRFETDHQELMVRPDASALLPRVVWHHNEPFADSSAIPSFAVSELARRHVTVALNGDGGDELLLGYNRYVAASMARFADAVPDPVWNGLSGLAGSVPLGTATSSAFRIQRFVGQLARSPEHRYAAWISCFDHEPKQSLYTTDFLRRINGHDSRRLFDRAIEQSDAEDFVESVSHADVQVYLPDDLLVKMDIASMANSLEVRSPFLDHEVVEFLARVPRDMKLRGFTKKHLLKRMMKDRLPEPILRRGKMGFSVPIEHWLRGELSGFAKEILLDTRAIQRGYFRREAVASLLDEHVAGHAHHHSRIWALLMLELWHRVFIDRACPTEAPAAF